METKFIEASNGLNWGKFLVGRFTAEEWVQPSAVDVNAYLVRSQGWGPEHLLVLDLATGEGALFAVRQGGVAKADLDKHRVWVCVLFEDFLQWLYDQDVSDLATLPDAVELGTMPAFRGYRRPGPTPSAEEAP